MGTSEALAFTLHDILFSYHSLIGGLFLSYLVYRIIHSIVNDNNYMQTKYRFNGHTWRSIQCNKSVPYSSCCTVCGKLMLPLVGLFCECCAVSACKRCHRTLDKKLRCKQISWPEDKPFYHQWVNVGVSRSDNSDSNEEGEVLQKFYCSWCQRIKICSENASNDTEQCDFQKYRQIIIPPTCVQVLKGKVTHIKPLTDNDWEPLIIFANRKSGSNRTDEILSLFRGLLNPIQVIDMSVCPPESASRWLPARCRVLVGGGDGSAAWLLGALAAVPHVRAAVGILPMGTGNDLSRSLGWGAGCSHLDAHEIIHSVLLAEVQPLDRWQVTIKPHRGRLGRLGRLRGERRLLAHCYASVGVDAQVALDFHRARAQFLCRYASRWLNYAAYAVLGAGRALDAGGCGALERRVRVAADGRALPLPPVQALVLLNIRCWGAGVSLWNMGSEDVPEQSMSDGKFEVVGISSSIHIARLQCGLAEPFRFTQSSRVEIELNGTCAMQVDGEPWMQGPATITMEHAGQSLVLRAPSLDQNNLLF
ncbi:diacylglycerol kinase epsilon-like [Epargyreus clarus]|uniref:diacylglycerol kinase epsilon-like n=1 Tax=Epargyreus clarus TaxID=520877 RepID=UPI003C2B08F8